MTKNARSGFSRITAILGLAALIAVPIEAAAALDGYMVAVGESQGTIQGSVDVAPHEGKVEVVEYAHSISQTIDGATGLPTGQRQHRPIRITKPVDKATAVLMQVLIDNENLTTVTFEFYRPGQTGSEEHYLTVELLNAKITNISQLSGSEDELQPKPAQEIVTLVYQKIIWTWEDGGFTAEDDWLTPTQ